MKTMQKKNANHVGEKQNSGGMPKSGGLPKSGGASKSVGASKQKRGKKDGQYKGLLLFMIGLAAFLLCLGFGIYGISESHQAAIRSSEQNDQTSARVEDVNRVVETMQTSASDMEVAVHTLDDTVLDMQDSLTQISSALPEDVDLKKKMTELNELTESLTILKEKLKQMESSVDKVSTQSSDQESNLTNISEETVRVSESILEARKEILRITEHLMVLQNDITLRISKEEDLAAAIKKAEVELGVTSKEISDRIIAVRGDLSNAESSITYLQEYASNLQIAMNQTRQELLNANQNLEGKLDSSVTEINDQITNQYTLYSGDLESMRNGLTGRIDQLESRVDSCFQSVSEGKRTLASALTDEGYALPADASFNDLRTAILGLSGQRYETGYNDGYSAGFKKAMDGASIEYTYHKHTGNRTDGGGCYSVECHEPGYYTYTYCNSTSFGTAGCNYVCTRCGSSSGYGDFHDRGDHNQCTSSNSSTIVYTYYVCSNGHYTTATSQPSSCQSQTSRTYHEGAKYYTLGCGKTEETIETATLKFN